MADKIGHNAQRELPVGTWGDPCVIFDVNGKAYYGHLSNPPGGFFIERIIVHRSSDGGKIWSDSVGIGYNAPKQQDKEWLACDITSSPFRNNLYMAWTEFDKYGSPNPQDSSRILFSRSTDSGQTWSAPVTVSDQAGDCLDSDNTDEGAVPAVGPNGEVYLSWSGPQGIVFDKSTDGGLTWGKDIPVTGQPGGWDFNVPGIYRANGLPMTLCDVSSSPHRGTVYIMWSDQRSGAGDTDVFLIKSTNGGQAWSKIKRVNDDITRTQQFFPSMAIDQSTGYLYIAFYDRRAYSDSTTDVYVARSTDGGETFNNFKVSQTSFLPRSSVFFGDYIHIAAYNRNIYPIWTRMDGTTLSIWSTRISEPLVSVDDETSPPFDFSLSQNYPNPFNASTKIRVSLPIKTLASLKVYDALGREVATLLSGGLNAGKHEVMFYGDNLASGLYFYQLNAGQFFETKKLVLLK
ncbi:MAG: T9SS type A sorting domain-containing protein [Ignavibacteriales bacterium]|nr:T9SS type A sorting domain-containing protein [Ignavibacteriales bacterium]